MLITTGFENTNEKYNNMVSCERQNWNLTNTRKDFNYQKVYDESVRSNRSRSLSRYDPSKCDLHIQKTLDDVKMKVRNTLDAQKGITSISRERNHSVINDLQVQGRQMTLNSPTQTKNRFLNSRMPTTTKSLRSMDSYQSINSSLYPDSRRNSRFTKEFESVRRNLNPMK